MLPAREFIILAVCLACVMNFNLNGLDWKRRMQMGQDLCKRTGSEIIDGIVPDSENNVYIVKGEHYWKLDGNLTDGFNLSPGYPQKINSRWQGIADNTDLDAVFYDAKSNLTYFLSGQKCWAYNDTQLLSGYPRAKTEDPLFGPYNENDQDDLSLKRMAITLGKGYNTVGLFPSDLGHVYFFKGTDFAKYRLPNGPIEAGYPKSIVPFWFQCTEPIEDFY